MDRMLVRFSIAVCFVVVSSGSVRASSDSAYAAFKADVRTTCTTLAKGRFVDPIVIVDAYGSVSYGFAQVYGRPQSPKGMPKLPGLASAICVYAKTSKKAELSGEIVTDFVAH